MTPCKHCGCDTLSEDESYCGADCAVDHAAELRGTVVQLRELLRDLYQIADVDGYLEGACGDVEDEAERRAFLARVESEFPS